MNARVIVIGAVALLVGYGFFSGFLPNATYSNWFAEALANGTLLMTIGAVFLIVGIAG